jgi:sucrose-phosphate synthase
MHGYKDNAFITRIECGPSDKYIEKAGLWKYIQEFTDNVVKFIEEFYSNSINNKYKLYVIHGHYADAGEVAVNIGKKLGIDVIFTGHSLGRNKLSYLLKQNEMTMEEIDEKYNIMRRIEAEETVLDNVDIIFSSTELEIKTQWGLYNRFKHKHSPKMIVISPGIDFSKCKLCLTKEKLEEWYNITHFLTYPHKQIILVICRPDKKKNIEKIVTVFGKNKELQDIANLVILFGNRNDIDKMSIENKSVVENVFKLIDKYDLYGKIAYPKKHTQNDISDLYLLAHHTRGVFVNIALQEPFGLTIIEAAAHGVPVVATENGGPAEIIRVIKHGILVDPTDEIQIKNNIIRILKDPRLWNEFSNNAKNNVKAYSWNTHRDKYFKEIEEMKLAKSRHYTSPFIQLDT